MPESRSQDSEKYYSRTDIGEFRAKNRTHWHCRPSSLAASVICLVDSDIQVPEWGTAERKSNEEQ